MSNSKIRAMMGASALIMMAGAAASAGAQTLSGAAVQVFGGGSTLDAPYLRQAADCYGTPTSLVSAGANAQSPVYATYPGFNYTGTPAFNCATTHVDSTVTFNFAGVGSGDGIQTYFTHNPALYTTTYDGTHFYPTVHFSASDTALSTADNAVYTGGGASVEGKTVNVVAPGVTATPGTNYPNPATTYGAMIQYPLLIAPVTVAYSPIYAKSQNASGGEVDYAFNLKYTTTQNGATIGVLRLNQETYCKIFNGYITNWNDPALQALNAKSNGLTGKAKGLLTLQDPNDTTPAASWSVPLQIVGRSDSSGTTSLFTRHLAAVCGVYLPAASAAAGLFNNYADSTSSLPSALQGPVATGNTTPTGETLGKFTRASGSGGVATYVAFSAPAPATGVLIQGRVGYLGPDYVNPYNSTYGLQAAALQQAGTLGAVDASTKYILPTPASVATAFGTGLPPESTSTGVYAPGVSNGIGLGVRTDPGAWVQPASKTAPLANPNINNAYPIVGTSNFLLYTCYADATAGSAQNIGVKMNQYLTWYNAQKIITSKTAGADGILATNGFADLPAAWKLAVKLTFLQPDATTKPLNLWVSSKSDVTTTTGTGAHAKTKIVFAHNTACDSVPGAQ